ncbi:MAG: Mrp/NBP35 family ATP-binding protein [Gammaproteobacteria bacterium]
MAPPFKHLLLIASGKGGVGKSTTAVNLALALAKTGLRVGLLDADIYGPNQPHLLGGVQRPQIDNQKMLPIIRYGLQTISIADLVDQDTPMVWRGPMVSTAVQQLVRDTLWDKLDYLVVDMPPGTGDIQLTMAQKMPVTGAIMVTTPQDVALLDVTKAMAMFEKVSIPIVGLIENMATHVCAHCGYEDDLFGAGGAQRLGVERQVDVLGSIPLHKKIREQCDSGMPIMVMDPEGDIALRYSAIGEKLLEKMALFEGERAKKTSPFPKVVVKTKE